VSGRRLVRVLTVGAVAILTTVLTSTAARAATVDTTPPTAPFMGYAEGFQCTLLIVGVNVMSTDNVTPQSQLRYQVYSDGVPVGAPLTDLGYGEGAWGQLHFPTLASGYHQVAVRAIDAAGNESALSNVDTVREYYTPGCVPGQL
jgi:hypothetical protein